MKKFIAFVFAAFLAAVLFADTETVDGVSYEYVISNGEAIVGDGLRASISVETSGAIVIPETLGGCPVTKINSRAFRGCNGLCSVTFPRGIRGSGDDAFEGCVNLSRVVFPASRVTLEALLGEYSRQITEVCVADGETNILIGAFYGCADCATVEIPASVSILGQSSFNDYKVTVETNSVDSVVIQSVVYTNSNSIALIRVDEKNQYFSSFDGLLYTKDYSRLLVCPTRRSGDVVLAEGLQELEEYALGAATDVTSVSLPSSITNISDRVFFTKTFIVAQINVGGMLIDVQNSTVSNANSIASIQVDEKNPYFSSFKGLLYTKDYSRLLTCPSAKVDKVELAEGLRDLEDGALGTATGVISVPASVTNISDRAFFTKTFTEEHINVGGTLVNVQNCTFSNANSIASIQVDERNPYFSSFDGLLYTKDFSQLVAFPSGKSGDIVLAEGLRELNDGAIDSSSQISTVLIPSTVTNISVKAFSSRVFTEINVGGQEVSVVEFEDHGGIENFRVATGNADFADSDGSLYTKDFSALVKCPSGKRGEIIIPNIVSEIGDYAFNGCSLLKSVTIPEGVTTIGDDAFRGCSSLTSLTIPSSVTTIGEHAFDGCGLLTTIEVSESNENFCSVDGVVYTKDGKKLVRCPEGKQSVTIPDGVTSIEGGAFAGCQSLKEIVGWRPGCPANIERIVISDSVTTIGNNVFSGCSSLASVTIPEGVTMIENGAFGSCYKLQSINVAAANPSYRTINGVLYTKDGSTLVACPIAKTSVAIPEGVTTIEYGAFRSCSSLTSVTIPSSVTTIGDLAFLGCSSLTSVTIPSSVTTIGYGSFSGCSSLTSVTIPDSVTTIGSDAFSGCTSLTSVTIPEGVTTIGNYVFSGCTSLTSVTIPSFVKTIGWRAFSGCSSLKSVVIPDGVTTIGEDAFSGCSSLTSIMIPSSVTEIGERAFSGCSLLTSVTIPSGVTTIGNYVFSGCSSLTSVTIPDSVTTIGRSAFYACRSLTSVTIPEGVTTIGEDAFSGCSSLTLVTIPSNVKTIEYGTFSGCSSLTSVTIPSSVTTIGYGSFSGCSSLTSVTIPDSVTTIGSEAFSGCSSLTSVTIPEGVTTIEYGAFLNCSSLTSVTIPESVTAIGEMAFWDCSSLTSVTIPNSVTAIGWWAFFGCSSLTSITIPEGVTTIGEDVFEGCESLQAIEVDAANSSYCSIDGVLYTKDIRTLVVCPAAKTSVTIPEGVTTIGEDAFSDCSSLMSVTMSKGVTTIETAAFAGCRSLTSVTIPEGVTTIGEDAFSGCSSLTSVTIPSSVKTIGEMAFLDCSSLTSVTIPDSVTTIGNYVFYGCSSLTSVTIPSGVTTIGNRAFDGCGSLTSVYVEVGDVMRVKGLLRGKGVDVESLEFVEVDYVVMNIPQTWAVDYSKFTEKFGTDFTKALISKSGKIAAGGREMLVWEDYVAGTDPTDPNDKFTASMTLVDGKPVISWTPELDAERAAMRKYTTYGKVKLTDSEWTVVPEGRASDYNFFKVTVEMK